ncbi:lipopolysaccharide biosynthesis protein [Acetobacter lambici]|nr:lipopolysaccharide biosynthesis protein [Acetobacter lambici]
MASDKSIFSSIFRNVGFLTAGRIGNALCSFIYISLAVRTLGLADFGLLILIHSLASASSMVSRMQSWQTLIHFGSEAFASKDMPLLRKIIGFSIRLDTLSATIALTLGIALALIYGAIAGWSQHIIMLALLYAFCSPFMYTGWSNGILRLSGKFHAAPIMDFLASAFQTSATFVGYKLHYTLGYFLLIWGLTRVIDYTASVCFALSSMKMNIIKIYVHAFQTRKWHLPGMWAFTRNVTLNQTLGSISGQVATLIIGGHLGPADAAIFRVSRQIADGMATPAQLLTPVLYPELIKMRDQNNWRGLKKLTFIMFSSLLFLSSLLIILSFFSGGKIFSFMFHETVSNSSLYISMMLVATACNLLLVPLDPLLTVMNRVRFLTINRTIITLLYFPLLYVFTSQMGLYGACIATVLSSAAVLLSRFVGIWLFRSDFRTR